ncbi:acyltransferase [Legionella sp. W05-934-2]|uniref:acyltransferase n=1 Tax=Legionella sp. W05-934-2 TaxID=1198649 RepID=UPI003462BE40
MKRMIVILLACLCLTSCKTGEHIAVKNSRNASKVTSEAPKTTAKSMKQCLQSCEQINRSCLSQCKDSCRICQKEADKQAWKSYEEYYQRMKIQGTYRPRDWLSFRDPLKCRKVSCSCPGDLNVCIQQCGGEIKKKLLATPYCE